MENRGEPPSEGFGRAGAHRRSVARDGTPSVLVRPKFLPDPHLRVFEDPIRDCACNYGIGEAQHLCGECVGVAHGALSKHGPGL